MSFDKFPSPDAGKGKRLPRVPPNIVQEVAYLAQLTYQDPKRLKRSVTNDKDCQGYLVEALEMRGYIVLLEEGIREAFADYRGPQKRCIMMLDKKVCVELRACVGLPKAPAMTQMKNYMLVTNCDCGMVISFPNDGSNSIDAKWVTFERGCFKTNDLLWKEGFICPDVPLETAPARPLTARKPGAAYESSKALLPSDEARLREAPGVLKAVKTARRSSKEEALQDEIKGLRFQNEQMLEDQKLLSEQLQQMQQKFLAHMEASAAQLAALQAQLSRQLQPASSAPAPPQEGKEGSSTDVWRALEPATAPPASSALPAAMVPMIPLIALPAVLGQSPAFGQTSQVQVEDEQVEPKAVQARDTAAPLQIEGAPPVSGEDKPHEADVLVTDAAVSVVAKAEQSGSLQDQSDAQAPDEIDASGIVVPAAKDRQQAADEASPGNDLSANTGQEGENVSGSALPGNDAEAGTPAE